MSKSGGASTGESFAGDYFDGRGSARTPVKLCITEDGSLRIFSVENLSEIDRYQLQELEVSSRLGNSPRYLNLPAGGSVETLDNDAVDRWLESYRPRVGQGWLHRLESNLQFVLLALLVTAAVVWGTVQFGVPLASKLIAEALPAELLDRASEETLLVMDKYMLEPSELSVERQQQLQRHFASALAQYPQLRVRVEFRHGMGANAFALPNGLIVFTDGIVKLSEHDDELLAVLAHEIGHVEQRHSLRRLVQNSLFVFMLAMITGDMSGTAEALFGLPVLFAELAYSREHETEADHFALQYLQANGIEPQRFADLMLRLEHLHNSLDGSDAEDPNAQRWKRYLSTHPITQERVQAFITAEP